MKYHDIYHFTLVPEYVVTSRLQQIPRFLRLSHQITLLPDSCNVFKTNSWPEGCEKVEVNTLFKTITCLWPFISYRLIAIYKMRTISKSIRKISAILAEKWRNGFVEFKCHSSTCMINFMKRCKHLSHSNFAAPLLTCNFFTSALWSKKLR